jgi:type IV secretory pathway VirB10-like protein
MMFLRRTYSAALTFGLLTGTMLAQEAPMPHLTPGNQRKPTQQEKIESPTPQSVALTVPKGTPLQVALDTEVRVKKAGEAIHGRVVQPVYAFDHIVIPVGSEVNGEITKIEPPTGGKRTKAALDADFTPVRKIEVQFHELVLADGRHMPVDTTVTPGSGQVIQFVSAAEAKDKKSVKDQATERTRQAKQQARQEWDNAMKQLKTPGRMKRIQRYMEAQLPVHRQFVPAGTIYFAQLEKPLDFGTEVMTPQMAEAFGGPLPPGSVVHAWLETPLTSATAHKGDPVEAVLSQPLLDANQHLVLPQGSRIKGTVRQVQAARRMKKNGQLRIEFRELVPPDGVEQKVEATLEGVQAGKNANVKLDSEGGAEATTPKTRYLATGFSLALAAASARVDNDADHGGPSSSAGGDPGSRVAGGANGFKLVGMVLGLAVHSRALGYTMGAYGAGMSVYSHFIARGTEVVFPKNTAMEIGVGTRKESDDKNDEPGTALTARK